MYLFYKSSGSVIHRVCPHKHLAATASNAELPTMVTLKHAKGFRIA
jgi:hypothetical protein